jgi:hypothetical protein
MAHNTFEGKGVCWSFGMGLERVTSTYSLTWTCTKSNNQLISTLLEHFWCSDKPRATSDSQDSPQPRLGGNHHLPPYSILYAFPQGPHLNGFLSQDSQMGVPKLPTLEFPRLCGAITLCADLRLEWGLKQSYNPRSKISIGMLQATCKQGKRVDSRLLMVRNQTAHLTSNLSSSHNSCFTCPNGSCEPILDNYVSIVFQWYKKLFNVMGFGACNCSLKISGIHLSKWELT